MEITIKDSPNHSSRRRGKKDIKFIIIHYTGMQSERVSLKRLMSPKSKVSSHFFINRSGKIYKLVNENKIAWHAGKSKWRNVINLNASSIGIELVNKGHRFGYEKFPPKQINATKFLIQKLKKKYKIKPKNILGHSDIAPLRKIDPGEKFPWIKLGLLKKYKLNNLIVLKKKEFRKTFFANLYKHGYRYFNKVKPAKTDTKIVKAFQRRFRQKNINGLIDAETLKLSFKLKT